MKIVRTNRDSDTEERQGVDLLLLFGVVRREVLRFDVVNSR